MGYMRDSHRVRLDTLPVSMAADLSRVASVEDVPSSSVKIGAVSAFTRKTVLMAHRPARLVGASLVDDGGSVAGDLNNYWEVQLRRLAFDPYGTVYRDMVLGTSGLLRYWPLNERTGTAAADATGTASNGAHTNGPTVAQAGPPGVDDEVAVSYDGTDDYTDLGSQSLAWNNSLSIEGWFRPASVAARQTVFGTDNAAAQPQIEFSNSVAGRLQVIYPSVTVFTGPSTFLVRAADWNHVLYTRNGAGANHRLYLNGVDLGSGTTGAGDFVDSTSKRTIGRRAAASQMFAGRVAHHALYNRALNQDDAEDRYGTIVRKSTHTNQGEAITQNRAWNFDQSRVSPHNQYVRQRDVIVAEFHPFGSPPALTDVTVSLRMEPV